MSRMAVSYTHLAQLLELYFAVQDITRAAERYDSHFVTQLTVHGRELELQLDVYKRKICISALKSACVIVFNHHC